MRILTAAVLAVFLTGCTDFLKEDLGTSYDKESMISTEEALESAMLGIHRQMGQCGFKSGAFCEWLAPGSGLVIWGISSALDNTLDRWASLHRFTRYSDHPQAYDSFREFYRTIYLCNHLLDLLKESPVDPEYVEEIEGEVLFIRAMSYFYLVRIWGDVSLHLEAPLTTEYDDLYAPRENFWTVYCQIVKDLDKAEAKMRSFERMVAVAGGNSSGRVCNYAATACRSLVYLTIGTLLEHSDDNFWVNRTPDFSEIGIATSADAFEKALADALTVIPAEHGGTGGTPFRLEELYEDLFRWTEPEDWQSPERIWVMPRSPESGDAGSGLTLWALPSHYMGRASGDNCGRCRPDRWFFQKWCEAYGGIKGTGAYNSNIYVDSKDPRMKVNLIYNEYEAEEGTTRLCYPSNWRITLSSVSLLRFYAMPYYKKYFDPSFDNSVGNADLYVMRLAEVYLIAAEASAYLGKESQAIDMVNHILARARKYRDEDGDVQQSPEPAAWTAAQFSSREELLNAIFWERCFEMPFEHHEYFDTHRMGAKWLVENISKPKNVFINLPEQTGGEFSYKDKYYGPDFTYHETWEDVRKGLINAYPIDELTYNPYLDPSLHDPNKGQNPVEVFWR